MKISKIPKPVGGAQEDAPERARTGSLAFIKEALVWTLPFVGLYFGLRALPVEPCEVLHHGEALSKSGEVELCGEEETGFFDFSQLRYPLVFRAAFEPSGPASGSAGSLAIHLLDHQGLPLGSEDIAISHTERLHLMVVHENLDDYHHLHPLPSGTGWVCHFAPAATGVYRLYLDFVPLRSGRRVVLYETLSIPVGEVAGVGQGLAGATAQQTGPEGYSWQLEAPDGGLLIGQDNELRLHVRGLASENASDSSQLVPFEKTMGAYAHLAAFDRHGRGFAHLHPRDPLAGAEVFAREGMRFLFNPDAPGRYRFWAQFRIAGQEYFVPFDLATENTLRSDGRS